MINDKKLLFRFDFNRKTGIPAIFFVSFDFHAFAGFQHMDISRTGLELLFFPLEKKSSNGDENYRRDYENDQICKH